MDGANGETAPEPDTRRWRTAAAQSEPPHEPVECCSRPAPSQLEGPTEPVDPKLGDAAPALLTAALRPKPARESSSESKRRRNCGVDGPGESMTSADEPRAHGQLPPLLPSRSSGWPPSNVAAGLAGPCVAAAALASRRARSRAKLEPESTSSSAGERSSGPLHSSSLVTSAAVASSTLHAAPSLCRREDADEAGVPPRGP